MTTHATPGDIGPLMADDRLIDALASGLAADGHDEVGTMLAAWRGELDAAAEAAGAAGAVVPEVIAPVTALRHRSKRRAAAISTAVVMGLTVSGGVAAAAAGVTVGPLGPINHMIYGPSRSASVLGDRINALLDQASAELTAAAADGAISTPAYHQVAAQLDQAAGLLHANAHLPGREALQQRLADLRRLLATLPILGATTGAPTSQPPVGHSHRGSPKTGPAGRHGHSRGRGHAHGSGHGHHGKGNGSGNATGNGSGNGTGNGSGTSSGNGTGNGSGTGTGTARANRGPGSAGSDHGTGNPGSGTGNGGSGTGHNGTIRTGGPTVTPSAGPAVSPTVEASRRPSHIRRSL